MLKPIENMRVTKRIRVANPYPLYSIASEYYLWQSMVYNVGNVRRPILTAQERLPAHRAEIQSFMRSYRCYSTGVNPPMVSAGMWPTVVEIYNGFNIWFDSDQGFYWVDNFEPAFRTREEARAFAATQVSPITEPTEAKSVLPLALLIGVASQLL